MVLGPRARQDWRQREGCTYSGVPFTKERIATTREGPRCEGTPMETLPALGLATALFTFGVPVPSARGRGVGYYNGGRRRADYIWLAAGYFVV